MEIIGAYNERGELDVSALKSNLESHLGIDTSNIGTTLPTGTITLDNIDFYINTDEEVIEGTAIANGSWNTEKQVNSPELFEGMTAVYWDDSGNEIELTESSSEEEWDNWYDYNGGGDGQNRWANAVTKDENGNITGYWVWIPRYAYKIESGLFTSTAGEISIKFLQNTSDLDSEGNPISREYSYTLDETNEVNNHMNDYVVHPAFRDGTDNNFMNGEWDEEVTGFWVAKYEAGYQANTITDNNGTLSTTISNSGDTVIYSDLKYTSYHSSYLTNALLQDLSETGYSSENISYPVFLPLTYSYNNICIGDSYVLSQAIDEASNFYGLNSGTTDSHQMKNSEWGAVAYLTQSSYGRDGTEITTNNYYTSIESPYKTVVTGLAGNSVSANSTSELTSVNVYNTENGIKASTTGNVTGIYDLSGGSWDRTVGYISNGNENLIIYGELSGMLIGIASIANSNGYKTLSTRNYTVYPYNSLSDSDRDNYNAYKGLISNTYGYGDAILETSSNGGSVGWNSDGSNYPNTSQPFFLRSNIYNGNQYTGVFTLAYTSGMPIRDGSFRSILIAE